jgi:Zn finger protein HypA/HybF involved in hydrogenase expression
MTEKTYPTRVDSSGSADDCDDCAYYSAAAGSDVYCPECGAEAKAIWRLEMETDDTWS